ncbi:putative ABC transporter permease protein [Actinoplanes missouriensis 431]|uniref:Putative ABC transporter permease protein n=1 Tax=Actinoplanes missouriensis (strain ATCC 14538 / DSM 43046 / CBS 188.64 / JCM 3121 / NBRC 102363 / NCIMB 12654 / NRRL B-3342 / UNCC 431) TaxID=512565 RepID=I0HCZ4_ACTM4|nr:ABC transporter permease [Actinoplanes missouriensis]BAL90881.1 putative ABC transporter permease protein [Actinoplanes missouriensis 431]
MTATAFSLGAPVRRWTGRLARVRWVTAFAVTVCGVVTLMALFAPWIVPHDPNAVDPLNAYAPISAAHPLGTDDLGRDLFSRLVAGARTSLFGPLVVVLAAGTAGTALAVAAAWFGGWFDNLVSRALDVLFAFPGLVLAITVAALFGAGFVTPVVALSLAFVPVIARVMRAAALRERSLPYIEALRVQGFSGWHICRRHLLPNLAPLLLVQAAIGFGYAMIDLASISFLGLGLQPPAADWGLMIANGQPSILAGFPQQSLYAAVAVVITVVAFTAVAERLALRFGGDVR